MIGVILRFIMSFCLLMTFEIFFDSFKENVYKENRKLHIVYVILALINVWVRYKISSFACLVSINLSVILVACLLKGLWMFKFAMLSAYISVAMGLQFQVFLLYRVFENTAFVQWDGKRHLMIVVYNALFMAVIHSLCKMYGHRQIRLMALKNKILTVTLTCSFLIVAVSLLVVGITMTHEGQITYIFGALVILCLFAIFYFMLYLIKIITSYMDRHFNQLRYISTMKQSEKHYAEVETVYRQVKDLKHDLKNKMLELQSYVQNGEYETLTDNFNEMIENINVVDQEIYTLNAQLNAILKVKIGIARNRGIKVEPDILFPADCKLKEGIMGVALGNVLDNAIEACERMQAEEKIICVKVMLKDETIYISVKNSKNPKEHTNLATIKADKENHGIGIRTVTAVFEMHGGYVNFNDSGDMFQVTGVMNLAQCRSGI